MAKSDDWRNWIKGFSPRITRARFVCHRVDRSIWTRLSRWNLQLDRKTFKSVPTWNNKDGPLQTILLVRRRSDEDDLSAKISIVDRESPGKNGKKRRRNRKMEKGRMPLDKKVNNERKRRGKLVATGWQRPLHLTCILNVTQCACIKRTLALINATRRIHRPL